MLSKWNVGQYIAGFNRKSKKAILQAGAEYELFSRMSKHLDTILCLVDRGLTNLPNNWAAKIQKDWRKIWKAERKEDRFVGDVEEEIDSLHDYFLEYYEDPKMSEKLNGKLKVEAHHLVKICSHYGSLINKAVDELIEEKSSEEIVSKLRGLKDLVKEAQEWLLAIQTDLGKVQKMFSISKRGKMFKKMQLAQKYEKVRDKFREDIMKVNKLYKAGILYEEAEEWKKASELFRECWDLCEKEKGGFFSSSSMIPDGSYGNETRRYFTYPGKLSLYEIATKVWKDKAFEKLEAFLKGEPYGLVKMYEHFKITGSRLEEAKLGLARDYAEKGSSRLDVFLAFEGGAFWYSGAPVSKFNAGNYLKAAEVLEEADRVKDAAEFYEKAREWKRAYEMWKKVDNKSRMTRCLAKLGEVGRVSLAKLDGKGNLSLADEESGGLSLSDEN